MAAVIFRGRVLTGDGEARRDVVVENGLITAVRDQRPRISISERDDSRECASTCQFCCHYPNFTRKWKQEPRFPSLALAQGADERSINSKSSQHQQLSAHSKLSR